MRSLLPYGGGAPVSRHRAPHAGAITSPEGSPTAAERGGEAGSAGRASRDHRQHAQLQRSGLLQTSAPGKAAAMWSSHTSPGFLGFACNL